MGRDHTLFSLVEGKVQFTRMARREVPSHKGKKWLKRPWRKFVNVIQAIQPQPAMLKLFR